MPKTIDVGSVFHHRLANRDRHQGDGLNTAEEFRERFLSGLDSKEAWNESGVFVELDFGNVKKIGPSFANAAFGYFMKYTEPQSFLKRVRFIHISDIHMMIIKQELKSAYDGK